MVSRVMRSEVAVDPYAAPVVGTMGVVIAIDSEESEVVIVVRSGVAPVISRVGVVGITIAVATVSLEETAASRMMRSGVAVSPGPTSVLVKIALGSEESLASHTKQSDTTRGPCPSTVFGVVVVVVAVTSAAGEAVAVLMIPSVVALAPDAADDVGASAVTNSGASEVVGAVIVL